MGRPSKLAEARDAIIASIAAGSSLASAADAAGVDHRTLERWLARGDADPYGEHGEFRRDVARARGETEGAVLGEIRNAVTPGEFPSPDWRARDRWLQLSNPDRFSVAAQVRQKVETELADGIERLRQGLDPETFARVLRLLAGPEQPGSESPGGPADGPVEH